MQASAWHTPGLRTCLISEAKPWRGNVPCSPHRTSLPQHSQSIARAGRRSKPPTDSQASDVDIQEAVAAIKRANQLASTPASSVQPSSSTVSKVRARLRPVPRPGSSSAHSAQLTRSIRNVPEGPTLGGSLKPASKPVRLKSLHTAYRRRQQLEAQQQAQQESAPQGRDPNSEGIIDYTWEVSVPLKLSASSLAPGLCCRIDTWISDSGLCSTCVSDYYFLLLSYRM